MEDLTNREFIDFLLRLIIDLIVAGLIIFGIYKVNARRKSFVFSLFVFNLIVFIIGFALNNIAINAGTGLGLFAIFAMLRYRSETLNFKEMTYLFMLIALGMINSLKDGLPIGIMLIMNASLVTLTYCMERKSFCRILSTRKLKYDNLELTKPQYKNLLIIDIFKKTGIQVKDIEIESISIQDKTASIILFYDEQEPLHSKNNIPPIYQIDNRKPSIRKIDNLVNMPVLNNS